MHMVSRKDLNSAGLETVKVSKNPTMVVTANGEVLTKQGATVYVKELGFIRDSIASRRYTGSSLGKLCEDHGLFLPMDQWPETTTHQQMAER